MNYIIYDIEATCWRGRPPDGIQEVIEIGAVKVNKKAEVIDSFSQFIRPTFNTKISKFCTQLTSITQKDVDAADTYDKVIQNFKDWIGVGESKYLLCSWGQWDAQILANNCRLHKVDDQWVAKYSNIKNKHQKALKLDYPMGLKNAVSNDGFEFTGIHHRAISDAENTAKVFIKHFDKMK